MNIPTQLELTRARAGPSIDASDGGTSLTHPLGVPLSSCSASHSRLGREDESPCMAAEWPAKQEKSSTPGVIRRVSEATATTGHMS